MSVLILLGLLLAAWIVDWIFVFRIWPERLDRLQSILAQDLARLHRFESWHDDLLRLAARAANLLYWSMFGVTGIHDMSARFADGGVLSIPDTMMRTTYIAHYDAIRVAMIGTQLFGVRLAVFTVAIPFFTLVYVVALTDGLVQRAVRRASGGRESGSLYHRAKHWQLVLSVTGATLSILLPISSDPRLFWLPVIAVIGVLARIQWVYYKKHL